MIRNLELYKVFYHVAATSSLTAAAKELSITQPAVSQSMKQLERQLGVKLFVRSGKGIRLSAEGELLFSYVAKGCDAFLEGEKRLKNILDLNEGELCIGATDYAIRFYLLPFLSRFQNNYPNIRVKALPMESDEIEKGLLDGQIELGLTEKTASDPGIIHCQTVKVIQDVFVAGAGFAYLRSPNLPYQLMTHLPLICFPEGSVQRKHLDTFFEKMQIRLQPAHTFAQADLIRQFVTEGLGIGVLPQDYVLSSIESGALIRLQFSPELPERELCLVHKDANALSNPAKTMLKLLQGEAG